jgi:hypothetical protein
MYVVPEDPIYVNQFLFRLSTLCEVYKRRRILFLLYKRSTLFFLKTKIISYGRARVKDSREKKLRRIAQH